MSVLTTPIQHRTGIPTKYNMSRERKKRHTDWKEVKLFPDEMNVCRKCHVLIKKARTNQWVKQHHMIEKSVVFYILAVNKWKLKFKKLPFIVAQKKWNTYIEISQKLSVFCSFLYTEVQGQYMKNYKTLIVKNLRPK